MAKKSYFIHVELWHNSRTQYGIAQYKTRSTSIFGNKQEIKEKLSAWADNVEEIKIDSTINNISINTDDRHIMQYGGYSNSNGLYCIVL